jgi:hypothetical protein
MLIPTTLITTIVIMVTITMDTTMIIIIAGGAMVIGTAVGGKASRTCYISRVGSQTRSDPSGFSAKSEHHFAIPTLEQ